MKNTLRALGGGVAVGIANVIPGVSGGTMMTIMNIFDRMMNAISGLTKKDNKNRLKDLVFLAEVGIGTILGIVAFSKLLEWLFAVVPMPTVFWFIGLVAVSVPVFLKTQMKGLRVNVLSLLLGVAVIAALTTVKLVCFPVDPAETGEYAVPAFSLLGCAQMFGAGAAGGFAMLLPGVSGSLVLMILDLYETVYFGYVNNATSFVKDAAGVALDAVKTLNPKLFFDFMGDFFANDFIHYIPAAVFAVGMLLGIVLSAKITAKALKWNKGVTLSFLLGLVSASAVSVACINYDIMTANVWMILGSIVAFAFGGTIVWLLGKVTAD